MSATREKTRTSHRAGRRGRGWSFAILLVLGLLMVFGVLSAIAVLGARARLKTGRDELQQGRELLLGGDVAAAADAFGRAEASFVEAADYARSPALRLAGIVPLAGRSVDALVVLADAGHATATAASEVSTAIDKLPGGIAELVPAESALPVDQIASLAPAIGGARDELGRALSELQALPTSWVVGPVADARDRAAAELEQVLATASSAHALAKALPALMGGEGVRHYFVAAQSPAELRGTGGFMGAYSILTAKDGRLSFDRMHGITDLREVSKKTAPTQPAGFGEPFSSFGGTGFWPNLNADPHAPTSAEAIEALYERVTDQTLDGVIFVDPQALADMLEATGPVEDPVLGRTLEAGSVVDYLANQAYLEFGSAAERKRILGAAVLTVFARFLDGTDPVASFRALADAGAGGHLVLHAVDPHVQEALETAGVAGTVEAPPTGDFFGAFVSNSDATKIDYYVKRSLNYRVTLEPAGSSNAQVQLAAKNAAPADPAPSYVFGPYPGTGLEPGVSDAFVTAYCAPGCRLQGATLDGEPQGLEAHTQRGLPVFSTFVETAPGRTSELRFQLQRPDAWIGDELGGSYRLRIRAQPAIRSTEGSISIQAPPGMRIVDATPGLRVDGGTATWAGDLDAVQEFEIRFQRPPLGRFWDLLSTPLFGD